MKILILVLLFIPASLFAQKKAMVIEVDAGIGPGTSSYIKNSIEQAEKEKMEALIIKLDTPGGLLDATRDIVKYILESKVPIIVYVAPGGARAGSAGVFITLAANIAAMAPGTNIGAAHPVGIGGSGGDKTSMKKIENDAAAFVRSIAQRRGRNADWAEKAVRESISSSENEALKEGVINFIAKNTRALLDSAEGMTVTTAAGFRKLELRDAKTVKREMSLQEELMLLLGDPNLAYIFIMLAIYGIIFELWNPGAIFPGVIGAISAILAAYSLQMLPINYVGLALIFLSVIFFILEIKVTSYGMLTVAGVITLALGSFMLIDSPLEFMKISLGIIITSVILTVLFFGGIIWLGLKAQKLKKQGGDQGMISAKGIAVSALKPGERGTVRVHGEIWAAISEKPVDKGDSIIVKSLDGLTLSVEPSQDNNQ